MRRIPLSHRSHIIGFQPLATGTAQHESALERDFVTLTSFHDPRASITAQPVTITFWDGSKSRRYTPDFLVRRSDGDADLIEVKYRDALREQWARLKPGFAAARAWGRMNGARFRIVTERQIRKPILENAKRLLPLRQAPLNPEIAELALRASRSLERPTVGNVIAAMPTERSISLATLWRLIARGTLRVELSAPITFDSLILS